VPGEECLRQAVTFRLDQNPIDQSSHSRTQVSGEAGRIPQQGGAIGTQGERGFIAVAGITARKGIEVNLRDSAEAQQRGTD
jgi:hypothetical protein